MTFPSRCHVYACVFSDESCNDFAEALSVGPSSMLANAGDLEMDVNDDRYASAMAMLQLLSGGQNALAVGDSPSTQQSDDQNGEGEKKKFYAEVHQVSVA